MPALRTILAKFGFDIDDKKLDAAKTKTNGFAVDLKNLSEKILGGSVKDAFAGWLSDVKDAASEFTGLARMTGTSTEEMQRWVAAAKLSGSSVEALTAGFRVLQKNASQAASGGEEGMVSVGEGALEAVLSGKKAQETFKALGVDVKTATGEMKTSSQLMGDVGLELAKVKSPAQRATLAMQLFGRQGANLLPLFAKGEKGLQEFLDRIDDLGGGVSQEAIAALKENSRASKEYDMATLSLKSSIVSALLPAMTAKVKLLVSITAWVSKTAKGTQILKTGMLILGAAILYTQRQAIAAGIKTAIAWAPTILLFAALALILDDVWTAFRGGDSVLGKFLDKLIGVGASKAIFSQMGADVDSLGRKLEKLPSTGDKIEEVFSTVGASIVKFFVDDIPEAFGFMTKGLGTSIAAWFTGLNDSFTYGLLDIIHSIVNWTKRAATAITDGISNGLTDGWEKVKKTFTELFESLEKDFKKFFRINSPSARIHDLTEFLPMGAVNALAEWEPKVREQSEETFASISPGSGTFAPVIRVPTVSSAGGPTGPSSKRVDMHNTFKIEVQGGGAGVRDAARDGVGLAFDDERRAMLAALEDTGD